jgi:hypothetical protein
MPTPRRDVAIRKPRPLPEERRLAAVDLFSALQRALDAGQRQLSSANNAAVDFVVKEFKVDAAVQLQMSGLGVMQLVLADDTTAPGSVSRVSLTLAAVAKMPSETSPQNLAQADLTTLADLTWLPAEIVALLATNEVRTVSEFLGVVADARVSARIISLLKRPRADIARWADRMRLLGLPRMTVPSIEVLGNFGILSIAALAKLGDDAFAELQRKTSPALPAKLLAQWREASRRSAAP